jgi:hypothetical protein
MTFPAAPPPDAEVDQSPFVWRTPGELEDIAQREPTNPMPLYLLANVMRRGGDPRWESVVIAASHRSHTTPQRVYARALMKIMYGDWSGWTDYDARLRGPDTIRDLLLYSDLCWKHQQWDGQEDLAGKSLVVLPEQGLGDCLQMWRFIPALLDRVESTILMLYPRLVPLARHNFGSQARIWLYDVKPSQSFDRYVWSYSLPRIFGALPPFRPLDGPGRRIGLARKVRPWRAGLCWAGNPKYPHDSDRSMPIRDLAPLLSRSDVEWISLQVGDRASDRDPYPTLHTAMPPLATFADTADLMADLDCVVTVDTSVAHLAGLLGVPTFLLVQLDSHWRWGLEDTTPWYPSMRLIRQRVQGDWSHPIQDLVTMFDESSVAPEIQVRDCRLASSEVTLL